MSPSFLLYLIGSSPYTSEKECPGGPTFPVSSDLLCQPVLLHMAVMSMDKGRLPLTEPVPFNSSRSRVWPAMCVYRYSVGKRLHATSVASVVITPVGPRPTN